MTVAAAVVVVAALVACAPASSDSSGAGAGRNGPAPANASRPTTAPPTTAAPTTTVPSTYVTPGVRAGVGGCALYPRDNAFHASIGSLPVTAGSASTIASIGAGTNLMAGFGSTIWQGSALGIPINVADGATAPREDVLVSLTYQYQSVTEDVPWPAGLKFEGWPGRAWDKHLVVVDSSTCASWELINVQPPGENYFGTLLNRWYADKVVKLDLTSNVMPVNGAATASGTSLLSGLVRYDEVAAGRVDHVLVMPSPVVHRGPGIWPSNGTDGSSTDPAAPPMGTWLRLRADTDISRLGPQARVVAQAMKDHGVIIVDSGPNAAIAGEPDLRWNDTDLAGLRNLTVGQFDVVDASVMKVADGSFQIR